MAGKPVFLVIQPGGLDSQPWESVIYMTDADRQAHRLARLLNKRHSKGRGSGFSVRSTEHLDDDEMLLIEERLRDLRSGTLGRVRPAAAMNYSDCDRWMKQLTEQEALERAGERAVDQARREEALRGQPFAAGTLGEALVNRSTDGRHWLYVEDLVTRLEEIAEQVFPSMASLPPAHLCYFYFCGMGSPVGSDEGHDAVPRYWWAQSELQELVLGVDLVQRCARLDSMGQGAIASAIRNYAAELNGLADSVGSRIEQAREVATREANALVCTFIRAESAVEHQFRLGWQELSTGRSVNGDLGGDPDRRQSLSQAIRKGPSGRHVIDLPGIPLPDDPERVANRYWAILEAADSSIKKIRYELRAAIERFMEYLKALTPPSPEPTGTGAPCPSDGTPGLAAACELSLDKLAGQTPVPAQQRSGRMRVGGLRKAGKSRRSMADQVRELLSGSDPFEGTKSELAAKVGYTHPSSLVNVKNFDNLWNENERKVAERRAQRQRRMDRGV